MLILDFVQSLRRLRGSFRARCAAFAGELGLWRGGDSEGEWILSCG
jgi:hypothetical protein